MLYHNFYYTYRPEQDNSIEESGDDTSEPTGETATRKLTFKHKKRDVEPPTPSKNLFSPALRADSHGNTHDPHGKAADHYLHTIESCDSGDTDPGDVHIEMNEPDEEIKQAQPFSTQQQNTQMEEDQEPEEDEEEIDDEDSMAFNPYRFIAELPDHATVVIPDKVCLPPLATPGMMSLVLDLDETLVHCTVEPIPEPDMIFPVE